MVFKREDYEAFRDLGDKNIFEERVDRIMFGKVCLAEHLKRDLTRRPVFDKRKGMLAFLRDDRDLFRKIRDKLFRTRASDMIHTEESVELLRQYFGYGEGERVKSGELATPLWLAKRTLDGLPAEIWSNPTLKWLDGATGSSTFVVEVVRRLMEGLEEKIPGRHRRYKWIVENMIHTAEIKPENVFLHLCLLDPHDQFDLNVYCGDFLSRRFERHTEEVWGVSEFDVIVGAPPHRALAGFDVKMTTLWHHFGKKYIELLVDGGYMACLHPSGWRSPSGMYRKFGEELLKREVLSLYQFNLNEARRIWGGRTNYDYYTLHNAPVSGRLTKVRWQDGSESEMDLSRMPFVPNAKAEEFAKLVAVGDEPRVKILYDRTMYDTERATMSDYQSGNYPYPCVHTVRANGEVNMKYSALYKGHIGLPKVIFTWGESSVPIIDRDGMWGLTQNAYGIVDDPDNFDGIKKALESEQFLELMKWADGGRQRYSRKVMELFRKDFWRGVGQKGG